MKSKYKARLHLVGMMLFIMITAYSQTDTDILGQWTGLQYIGSKPSLKKTSSGGFQTRRIYDSCQTNITIDKLDGVNFSGYLYTYFISDQQGSYLKAAIEGTIIDLTFHLKNTKVIDKKLKKYPGSYWCTGEYDLNLSKKGNSYYLQGLVVIPRCFGGPLTLAKVKPAENLTSESSRVLQPDLISDNNLHVNEMKLYDLFKKRKATVIRNVEVESDVVRLSFYDNGIIDNDSISVFYNDKILFSHQKLSAAAFNIILTIDNNRETNEIAMFADNLGSIPPNTSLMKLSDGKVTYDIFMSSTFNSNAVVQIKRKKKISP